MLDDRQKDAVRRWYARPEIVDKARALHREGRWEDLEEHVNMLSLRPLGDIDRLPDYLKHEDGKPLIPSNLNPHKDIEAWRDAVEVGWEVMDREIGVSQELLHQHIARSQNSDWEEFVKRGERRKKERGMK
ncbi:MAG: hypothetical protein JRS35_04505 [Deltaproteobacteria bacterium]|nr:hypothetical protein [Deltaproteobacteria bacterium]